MEDKRFNLEPPPTIRSPHVSEAALTPAVSESNHHTRTGLVIVQSSELEKTGFSLPPSGAAFSYLPPKLESLCVAVGQQSDAAQRPGNNE